MKVLFLNAYFLPEKISFTHLEQDLLKGLVDAGHEVEIICPTPTRGISPEVAKEYKHKLTDEMLDGKVRITRFPMIREGRNPITRALRYYMCTETESRLAKKREGVDIVFAVSTPPTQGQMAGRVAKKLGCPFLYSLQDIFPDSLVTTGLAKEGSFLYNRGVKIASETYSLADKIVVIANSFIDNLKDKGINEDKVAYIPNWTDTSAIHPVSKTENKLFDELNIDRNCFTVVYAGNFGEAQGAEVIINAAKILRENNDIKFVIFGGGSRYDAMCEEVKHLELTNVVINPLLPQERVAEVYSIGDVALVTCKKGVGGSGMPSKTWSIMACNTPIIASFDTNSELATILQEANAGVCVEPENAEALAKAILDSKSGRISPLNGGREYVCSHVSKEICVGRYIELMEELVD